MILDIGEYYKLTEDKRVNICNGAIGTHLYE